MRCIADDLIFGEGLRWFKDRVWLSDMLGRQVLTFSPNGQREVVAIVAERPNGLGFLPDGRLLVTSMADQKLFLRQNDGTLTEYASLQSFMTGYCGDMAVDARGRAYLDDVGYRVFEGEPRRSGRLILVEENGGIRILEENLEFPNGMWINVSQKELIFAEGRRSTLWSYDLQADGSIFNKRVFAHLPDQVLDGLTMDIHGAVWVCSPYKHKLLRVERGGKVTNTLDLGELKPVACCLGGADFKTLYFVASDYTLERLAKNDAKTCLFATEVEVPGFALPAASIKMGN